MKRKICCLVFAFATILSRATDNVPQIWEETNKSFLFNSHYGEYSVGSSSNLIPFGPFHEKEMFDFSEIVRTNGILCIYDAASQAVCVLNKTTNCLTVLRMPPENLCKIALLDENGSEIRKTELGSKFGDLLPQSQIEEWRKHWHFRQQSVFLEVLPNGSPAFADLPTVICKIDIRNIFEISKSGVYELHLQLRLVQVGRTTSGQFYYPITNLREIASKIRLSGR